MYKRQNRNYPIGWQDESQQAGAGAHPLSNPETQANAAFLLAHPNVCLSLIHIYFSRLASETRTTGPVQPMPLSA